MEQTASGTKQVILRMKPEYHKKLTDLSLIRSIQLGRRVSMTFVVEEILEQIEQMEDVEKRSADLFGSHE
jgi:predicted DNA-binding protein